MKKLAFLLSFLTFSAVAQEADTVLFKISDVQPIKNKDNETTACEYTITAYNRTDKDLSQASLTLSWEDDVVKTKIEEEKKQTAKVSNIFTRGKSKTQQFDSSNINVSITLPSIPAKRQIIRTNKALTTKCYLLLNKAEYSVNSCSFASNNNVKIKNSLAKSNADCKNIFILVDSNNDNYYTEFSNDNYEVLEKKKTDLIQEEKQAVENMFNQSKSSISNLEQTINEL